MTTLAPQSILLLGNSPKFAELMAALYPHAQRTIVSWRMLGDPQAQQVMSRTPYDLIVICGYDYQSAMYAYERYWKTNVLAVINALQPDIDQQVPMIYIDTLDSGKSATYSRYVFAKKSLASQLQRSGAKVAILPVPTLTNADGQLAIHGGWMTRQLFGLMHKLGLVQTMNPITLQTAVQSAYGTLLHPSSKTTSPKQTGLLRGRGLSIPRPLLFDRALRIICG